MSHEEATGGEKLVIEVFNPGQTVREQMGNLSAGERQALFEKANRRSQTLALEKLKSGSRRINFKVPMEYLEQEQAYLRFLFYGRHRPGYAIHRFLP